MARYEELNRRLEKHQATDIVCPFFPMKQMTSNDLTIRREGGSLQFCRPVLQLAVGFLVPLGMDLLRKPRVFLKLMNMTMPRLINGPDLLGIPQLRLPPRKSPWVLGSCAPCAHGGQVRRTSPMPSNFHLQKRNQRMSRHRHHTCCKGKTFVFYIRCLWSTCHNLSFVLENW